MSVRSGQAIAVCFVTSSFSTGAATNADSLPTGVLYINGVANAAAVTVTNLDAGRYRASVTLPTLAVGDVVELSIAATVGAVVGKGIIYRDTRDVAVAEIALGVWDEVLSAAAHNVPNSAGKRLRTLATNSMHDGIAQGGTANTITLDTAALATNGAYDPGLLVILSGTGAGQGRLILDYVGATRVAVVDRDWRVIPDNTSEFTIMGATTAGHVHEGVAAGATLGTMTLGDGARPTNDIYKGQVIFIKSGTGQDQARSISAYNGTTRVASVTPDWDVLPDTTSGYVLVPGLTDPTTVRSAVGLAVANLDAQLAALGGATADAVWDEVLSGSTHNIAGSAGKRLRVLSSGAMHEGIAQGGGINFITLAAAAAAVDGTYDPALVTILAGTGAGQSRLILDYAGASRRATVDKDWQTIPDTSSEYIITGSPGGAQTHAGVAAAATPSTITFGQGALAEDRVYEGQVVCLRSGTGADQVRSISAYDGATRVATITPDWDITPDTTSGYLVLPAQTDRTDYSLAAGGLDAVVVEVGLNARQALAIIASASAGVLAGAGTSAVTIAAAGVPAQGRVAAAVDGDGNRLSVTLNLPV